MGNNRGVGGVVLMENVPVDDSSRSLTRFSGKWTVWYRAKGSKGACPAHYPLSCSPTFLLSSYSLGKLFLFSSIFLSFERLVLTRVAFLPLSFLVIFRICGLVKFLYTFYSFIYLFKQRSNIFYRSSTPNSNLLTIRISVPVFFLVDDTSFFFSESSSGMCGRCMVNFTKHSKILVLPGSTMQRCILLEILILESSQSAFLLIDDTSFYYTLFSLDSLYFLVIERSNSSRKLITYT